MITLKLCLTLVLCLLRLILNELVTDVSSLNLSRGGPTRRQEVASRQSRGNMHTTNATLTYLGIAEVKMILSGILNCKGDNVSRPLDCSVLVNTPWRPFLPKRA